MKKLMISAIAVMLGFAANAAAVTWSIAGIQSSPANTATTGWYVQIFESATSYTYADAKVGNITAWSSAMTTGTTSYKATEKVLDAADKGDTVAIYEITSETQIKTRLRRVGVHAGTFRLSHRLGL